MSILPLYAASVLSGCTPHDDGGDSGVDSAVDTGADSGDSGAETGDTGETGETGDTADTAPDSGDSGDTGPVDDGILHLDDAHNYAYALDLDVGSFPVAAGVTVDIDWSGVVHDLGGTPIDPANEIGLALLLQFPAKTEAEVAAGLATDSLLQEDVGAWYTLPPFGAARASMGTFESIGHAFDASDLLVEGSGTWLVALILKGRIGVATVAFLDPQDAAPVADVILTAASTTAVVTATPGAPLTAHADAPWPVEWAGLTTTALGAPLAEHPVDSLTIYRFDALDADEVTARFAEVEALADARYITLFSGSTALDELSSLVDAHGEPFAGFTAGATWAVSLRCSQCMFPPPAFAALVTPEAP